ncbi:odorant receptor Or1-like [Zophobas morio]|uniref:odorant receptor Or1-like n=1 Tax=Zophobas morio TaxID=2755281 RepID=UPI0030835997
MRLLGFYPPQKFKKIYQLYAYAVYVTFTIPVPTLAAVHLLVSDNVDLAQVGDGSFMMFQVGCFIAKLVPFIFHSEVIRKSIYMLEWPVFNNYSRKQEVIIEKGVKTCKRITWLFLGFCVTAATSWAVTPLFGSGHTFPIEIWLPFDATSNKKIYVFTYIFIASGVFNGGTSNGVIDPLVAGMACFAATQLRVLKDNLQNLGADAEEIVRASYDEENKQLKEKLRNDIIYNKIGECITHHAAIIK